MTMEKIIVFGTGSHFQHWKEYIPHNYKIIAFADNSVHKIGTQYDGLPIISPAEITEMEYDKVYIASSFQYEIINQLLDLQVPEDKIEIQFCLPSVSNEGYHIDINAQTRQIKYQVENVKFTIKNKCDFQTVHEIFGNGCYNITGIKSDAVVIDIGMNIGLGTLYFANKEYVKDIYAYEPFLETYEIAISNFEMNSKQIRNKIHPYNYALGVENAEKECAYSYDSSINMSLVWENSGENKEKIKIRNAAECIKNVIEQHKDNKIIIKSDCEGSEFDIFELLDREFILSRIDIIVMEFHGTRVNELEKILTENSFQYVKNSGYGYTGLIYAFRI